jgi:hypothetical protein
MNQNKKIRVGSKWRMRSREIKVTGIGADEHGRRDCDIIDYTLNGITTRTERDVFLDTFEPATGCNCISDLGKRLKEKNIEFTGEAMAFNEEHNALYCIFMIDTKWIDKAKAPRGQKAYCPKVRAAFCPFCGMSLEFDPSSLTKKNPEIDQDDAALCDAAKNIVDKKG